jgi:Spy/CpxP family protein refolding chaperone
MLWGAALLLGGMGIGVGGTLLVRHPPPPPPFGPPGFAGGPGLGDAGLRVEPLMRQMKHDLQLTNDQATQVEAALSASLDAIKALRSQTVVQLSADHEKLRDQLKKILTPEQFADWSMQYENARSRLMPDGPPLGGPLGGPRRGEMGGPPNGPGGGPPGRPGPWGGPPGGPEGGPPGGPPDERPGQDQHPASGPSAENAPGAQ